MRPLLFLWVAPATLIGLLAGSAGLATGGRVRRVGRVLEFWGGSTCWLLRHTPLIRGSAAVTFGHVILAPTQADLDDARGHELVHVRQYERWGPFFLPAYLLCWLVLWMRGRNGYLDNPFEREAYNQE